MHAYRSSSDVGVRKGSKHAALIPPHLENGAAPSPQTGATRRPIKRASAAASAD
jgi:hypothetical protein